ncbi:MAG: sigma-70 family RNA polymerase sigma factor [Deltaproteobacteria bacterium]|nr:sigma-70 family RNA polymerase sigma factor [Deltaproteobacteria bacterium]
MADRPATSAASRGTTIAALYERHKDRLFQVALRVGGGRRSFAEDVVHDVFVSLLKRYDDLADTDDLGGWLYRVAMNAALTRLRREAVRANPMVRFFLGDLQPELPSPDVRARLDEGKREALAALAALPPRERVAFCMVQLDEAPLAHVASVLGCSVSYACKLAKRAEAALVRAGYQAGARRAPPPELVDEPPLHTPSLGVRYG